VPTLFSFFFFVIAAVLADGSPRFRCPLHHYSFLALEISFARRLQGWKRTYSKADQRRFSWKRRIIAPPSHTFPWNYSSFFVSFFFSLTRPHRRKFFYFFYIPVNDPGQRAQFLMEDIQVQLESGAVLTGSYHPFPVPPVPLRWNIQ